MYSTKKKLLFLFSPNGVSGFKKFMEKLEGQENDNISIVAGDHESSQILQREGVEHTLFTDYSPSYEDVLKNGMKWFKAWQNIKIKGDKNVKELFEYNGISLWWFIDYWLYESSFFFNPPLFEIIQLIETSSHLAEVEKPDSVFIFGDETYLTNILQLIFSMKKISIQKSVSTRYIIDRNRIVYMKAIIKLLLMCGRILLRKGFWYILNMIYRARKEPAANPQHHILMFSADYWREVYDPATLKKIKGDGYLHPIITELKKDQQARVTFVGLVRGFDIGINTMKKRIIDSDIEYRPFENYLSIKMIMSALRHVWKERSKWKELINSRDFRESLSYNNLSLFYVLKPRFSFFLQWFPLIVILNIEMAKRLVESENPEVIVI